MKTDEKDLRKEKDGKINRTKFSSVAASAASEATVLCTFLWK